MEKIRIQDQVRSDLLVVGLERKERPSSREMHAVQTNLRASRYLSWIGATCVSAFCHFVVNEFF
jgi:hypothetical protein